MKLFRTHLTLPAAGDHTRWRPLWRSQVPPAAWLAHALPLWKLSSTLGCRDRCAVGANRGDRPSPQSQAPAPAPAPARPLQHCWTGKLISGCFPERPGTTEASYWRMTTTAGVLARAPLKGSFLCFIFLPPARNIPNRNSYATPPPSESVLRGHQRVT